MSKEADRLISIFVGIGVFFWMVLNNAKVGQFFNSTAGAAVGLSSGIAHI